MADLSPAEDAALKRLGAALAEAGLVIVPFAEWEELQALRAGAHAIVAAIDLTRETERLGLYDPARRVTDGYRVRCYIPPEPRSKVRGKVLLEEGSVHLGVVPQAWSVRVELDEPVTNDGRAKGKLAFLMGDAPGLSTGGVYDVLVGAELVMTVQVEGKL